MSDYKHTLNLPKTDFAMKANLAQREPQALKRWYAEDYYGQIRKARAGREKFILHDGPPYAKLNKTTITVETILHKFRANSGINSRISSTDT